jgi:hypothetical protein
MVRHIVAETPLDAAEALADEMVGASDAGTVRRRVRDWCVHHLDSELYRHPEET